MAISRDCFEWAAKLFDSTRIHEKPEALRGIRGLDLSVIYFAAEVIKVEMPGQGDVLQTYLGYGPRRPAGLGRQGIV